MIWILIIFGITIGMWAFTIYCSDNINKTILQILLPIAYMAAVVIVYFIIVPLQMGMSLYERYIHAENKWFYFLSAIVIIVIISQTIDLYKNIKIWKTGK